MERGRPARGDRGDGGGPITPYTSEFFAVERARACASAEVVVPLVLELTGARSVVDVGCGTGTWLAIFAEHGIDDLYGIDGGYVNATDLEIPSGRFLAHDLAAPLTVSQRFDLVLALEVAEHLPPESAATFVGTLTSLGEIILFSAAIPGQGGTNHVNEQWPSYWAALFHEHHYVHVDCLRRRLWHNEAVAPWYAQNIVFYIAREELPWHEPLARHYDPYETSPAALVHPSRYLEWVDWALDHVREE